MFKPSQPMMARLRLTTKQVNGGYYKGTRSGSMGYFAKNGSYVIDWKKVRTYAVPENLDQFKLTPFVTKAMAPTKSRYTDEIENADRIITREKAFGGKDYLGLWASDNGLEVLELERLEREGPQAAKDTQPKKHTKTKGARAGAKAKSKGPSKSR